jgi:hypothetical protein
MVVSAERQLNALADMAVTWNYSADRRFGRAVAGPLGAVLCASTRLWEGLQTSDGEVMRESQYGHATGFAVALDDGQAPESSTRRGGVRVVEADDAGHEVVARCARPPAR